MRAFFIYTMAKVIWIPGSIGELLDKVSILNIKRVMITDTEKLSMVKGELQELMDVATPFLENKEVEELYDLLLMVNKNLWDVEEDRKSTRLNSSHIQKSRMPSSA